MPAYHPNFFEWGGSIRTECRARLDCILEHVESGSVLDVGCSGGFFSFGVANAGCSPVLGLDFERGLIDKCREIQDRNQAAISSDIQFKHCSVEDYLEENNPDWDTILYMSTHHHILVSLGWERAGQLLGKLCRRTTRLIFDMGQKSENCRQHAWWKMLPELPGDNQEAWLVNYLTALTGCSVLRKIGEFPSHKVPRYLWLLETK